MVDRSLPTVVHCVMLVWMDVQLISALPSAQSLRVHSVRSKAWEVEQQKLETAIPDNLAEVPLSNVTVVASSMPSYPHMS